ncbi:peptidyl-tRNA hydrolase [Ectothiorhodosinus mongolicus]|uniref:Peptidyl-tRNA hydrolase n=1 Tax=Ectothiorhodosinus mongolicus TaxID=233100 RepID=A0A1R3W2I6_9GAMM|nr:aminoacyl-tRNA hydrolase [Ectothiorhodosinus mongolicus]ULX57360.1 aminoacyl-tRNA hydrolase [Ectothiorhodosinus mongolicus]SIT71156.1 peptidyl-tRNA hydrolase [Ectothiorhodosinus mongolicus]
MGAQVSLIAGLGNPGPKYEQTRHNAGFWLLDALVREQNASFRLEARFGGEIARIQLAGHDVWLLKPMSFMNHSGQPLRQMAHFYKLDVADLLVVHDEIDLPPGTARLKKGGGHGGHNGLRHILSHFSADFCRLRLGVGHPGHKDQVVNYVLDRPSRDEEEAIHAAIQRALQVLPLVVGGEWEKAMNQLHTEP